MNKQEKLRVIKIEEAKIKASQLKIKRLKEDFDDEDLSVFDYNIGEVETGKIPVTPSFQGSNGTDAWTGPGYPPFSKLKFKSPVGELVIRDYMEEGEGEIIASLNGEDLSLVAMGEETTVFANDSFVVFYTVSCRRDFRIYTVIYEKDAISAEVMEEIESGDF